MNVLAIDTSTLRAAVALTTLNGEILSAEPDPLRKHASGLVPAISRLLASAGLTARQLDGLAVGLGPGSFTGLRVGVAALKTLAYASGVPLVGLDSLEVLARGGPEDARMIRVVGDAQRGEVFAAEFARREAGGRLRRLGETRIEARDVWVARLEPGDVALGPGLERPGPPLPLFARTDPGWNHPRGEPLARLAVEVLASGRRDDPTVIEPLYLRRSAAEDQKEARS
ncbi:MAG TPA: tRNA (adenosine(37)-N6)-threonylcarbamoyltransferase complex dimerization subunit type 1 TsaB [Isosphaeraceae bacterium]|nr:tRNA (adenosine(37)-N6)-threonylcarbamoyltransferase complex dimerization subunit type 1 TsaB [Isosphaeraceae bacterium]